jgi:hypothetical protein
MTASRIRRLFLCTLILGLLAAAPASAASTLLGVGDDFDAVTDHEGTTHVVWEKSTANARDQLVYCRILRGDTTCHDQRTLTAMCPPASGGPYPAEKRDHREGGHGDGPSIGISPFGDVVLTSHGLCGYDWNTGPECTPPHHDSWCDYADVDYVLVTRSTDDGDTFGDWTADVTRPWGPRGCTCSSSLQYENDADVSTTVYDYADSRLLTIGTANGGDYEHGTSYQGLYIYGTFPPPPRQPMTTTARGRLGDGSTIHPSVVQTSRGHFVVAATNNNDFVSLYSYDCEGCPLGDIHKAANWSGPIHLPAEDYQTDLPKLVTGPSGTFLFYRTTPNGSSDLNWSWWVRKLTGNTLGARHLVAGDPHDIGGLADFVEDTSNGRLIASIEYQGQASPPVEKYAVSDDAGSTWTTPAEFAGDPDGNSERYDRVKLTAATGDDGFTGLVLRKRARSVSNDDGPIWLDELPGSGDPPPGGGGGGGGGQPGGGGGGGDTGGGDGGGGSSSTPPPILATPPVQSPTVQTDACKVKQFGPLDVKADACLELNKSTGAVTAKGGVDVNGLHMAGASITFDPKLRTVKSAGPVTVAIGDTKLFKLPIDWKLPAGNTFTLPSIDVGDSGGKLKGLPVEGSADIKLVRGGVEIPLHIGLPKVFGEVTGDVTIRADNLSGIHLREIHAKANLATIGPLTFSKMSFDYDPDEDKWGGGATLALPPKPPGPVLESQIGFFHGDLDYVRNSLTFPGDGIPMDPTNSVYLTQIRFSLETHPDLKLSGGVTFNAGPKFGGYRIATINGDLTFIFPDGQPATLRADGTVELMQVRVGSAFLQYRTDGLVTFGGDVGLDVADVVSVHGTIGGYILLPDHFSIEGGVRICAGDLGCAKGTVVVSTKGFAACVKLGPVHAGVGYKWGPTTFTPAWISNLELMKSGCSVGKYRDTTVKASQAGGARTVDLDAGLPFAVFHTYGATAPPHVLLTSPSGKRIDVSATQPRQGAVTVLHVPSQKETIAVVQKPEAGSWKIEAAPDSSPIASAGSNDGLPEPQVRAKVSGSGHKRFLSYEIKPLPGQKVQFEERGKLGQAGQSLGYAHGNKGKLRFAPATGPKGRRDIVAIVESYDTPRDQLKVASYAAPANERPAKPKGLKVKRKGTKLLVSWTRVARAARYRLLVKLSDGRVLLQLPTSKARSAAVADVGKKVKATVTLRAEFADGTAGPTASYKLRSVSGR